MSTRLDGVLLECMFSSVVGGNAGVRGCEAVAVHPPILHPPASLAFLAKTPAYNAIYAQC